METNEIPAITSVQDLKGKVILVRVSFNVPIENGKVRDSFRILKSLETITYLLERRARVILVSHLGKDGTDSLLPVYEMLRERIDIKFSPEVLGNATTSLVNALEESQALLLENVRRDEREKENDIHFAKELASLADMYVNDDFAASHREHASLHAICRYLPSYAGINFIHEYANLSKALHPQSPSLFILGGAKFETKVPLVEKFLELYDHLFIGGAIANDFFKAKGYEVGTSLVSDYSLQRSPLLSHPKIMLPTDVIAVKDGTSRVAKAKDVMADESILDVGPDSLALLNGYIGNANTILWNGPLGNYEGGYQDQTLKCAQAIAQSQALSVVGGGDTVASIEKLDLEDSFGFLSTAGGAMLTFLELGTLPALDALLKK